MNIIYRAKKIDSAEYVEGFLFEVENYGTSLYIGRVCSYLELTDEASEINHTTLAIHLPDMIDSEGARVFASLSEDGKGGDTFDAESAPEDESLMATVIFKNGYRTLYDGWDDTLPYPLLESRGVKALKVLGINRG